jgi:hypothetical protein
MRLLPIDTQKAVYLIVQKALKFDEVGESDPARRFGFLQQAGDSRSH